MLQWLGVKSPKFALNDLMHNFCGTETLSGYKCDHCKNVGEATQTMSLEETPEILTVHLKRFKYGHFWNSKLTNHVEFPISSWQLDPFRGDTKLETTEYYDLVGVVNHYGFTFEGHYTAFTKNHLTGKWYKCDDEFVDEMDETKLISSNAYILFYQRRHIERNIKPLLNVSLEDESERISHYWLSKYRFLQKPGPISALTCMCEHGQLRSPEVSTHHCDHTHL